MLSPRSSPMRPVTRIRLTTPPLQRQTARPLAIRHDPTVVTVRDFKENANHLIARASAVIHCTGVGCDSDQGPGDAYLSILQAHGLSGGKDSLVCLLAEDLSGEAGSASRPWGGWLRWEVARMAGISLICNLHVAE